MNSQPLDTSFPSFSSNFNSLYSQRKKLRRSVSTASSTSDDETRYISRDPACVLHITETGKNKKLSHYTEETSGSSFVGNSDIERRDSEVTSTIIGHRRNTSENGYFHLIL